MNTNDIKLPPLPEWTKMDNLANLVPSEIRQSMVEYALAAIKKSLQSQEGMERVINAARDAMDASFEHDDGYQDLISVPSEKAASLSLALDEYDRACRIEGDGA